MKNASLFFIAISSFESTPYKKLWDTTTCSFVCYCFTSAFTSGDIIFHNFLELHLKLSETL